MARMLDDPAGNDRLISWLKVMFPEAGAESVLRPAENPHKRSVYLKTPGTGRRNTPYGLISYLLSGRSPRSPRIHTTQ